MRWLFSSLLFLFTLSVGAQLAGQPFIDSLVKELPTVKDDTIKTRLYKKIVEQYANNNPTEAMRYLEQGIVHVTAMKWEKGIAVFNNLMGNMYSDKGDYTKAIELFDKAYTFHLSDKDYYNAASASNNIGNAYLRQSMMDKAMGYFLESLQLAEKIDNKYMTAVCFNNIGLVYFNQYDYIKTLEYQNKALKIYRAEKNKDAMADNYSAIGNTYLQKKDTVDARKYYTEAIGLYEQTNNQIGVATVYTNLSNLYTDLTVNLGYKLKAQKIWNSMNPAHPISIVNMGNIGLSYLDFARYDSLRTPNLPSHIPASRTALLQKAGDYLNQGIALSLQTGDMGNYSYLTGIRAEVEAEKGDYKKAYFDLKNYYNINDSIYSQENKNKIAVIEGQREVSIRDKEIAINKLAFSVQRKQRIGLIAGIALLCITGAFLYRQSRLRKKTNTTLSHLNSELDEANKVKAKFFAIISHDLRSPIAKLVNFLHLQKEEPGMLSSEQIARQQQKITASAENLLDNMETILLWSKGQMENFKPVKKQVKVSDLFRQVENTFSGYDKTSITFINPENISLNTDQNYLYTILQNLTTNAIKALQNTSGAVIEWKAWKENNDTFFSIADNGPGFPSEFISDWNKNAIVMSGKHGLGMHIVKDMAKAIDCIVTLSGSAKGAMVTLAIAHEQ